MRIFATSQTTLGPCSNIQNCVEFKDQYQLHQVTNFQPHGRVHDRNMIKASWAVAAVTAAAAVPAASVLP